MTNLISGIFKGNKILPNQLNGKKKIEVMNDCMEIDQTDNQFSENEDQLIEAFREFTITCDLDLLIDCYDDLEYFTNNGYSILLNHNFFGFFSDFIGNLLTIDEVKTSLEILLYFSDISSDISEQILGNFNDKLNMYLSKDSYFEIHDLCLELCKRISIFPTVVSSFFSHDEIKLSHLSRLFNYSPHLSQRKEIIKIYKNIAKFDLYQYDLFIKEVFKEDFMIEILSLTETMKLLRYLSKKTTNISKSVSAYSNEEEEEESPDDPDDNSPNRKKITFASQIFITNLREALLLQITEKNSKYVKNCLKFINIRCSNLLESLLYYEQGFSDIFLVLPDDFIYYISLIYMGLFQHIPNFIDNMDFLEILIEKLDVLAHNGIYSNKVVSINLISKMIFKKRDLSQNKIIINIVFDSLDLLLSSDLETIFRFLDLLIRMCQWERNHNQRIVIDGLISRDIGDLFDEIASNITELNNDKFYNLAALNIENNEQISSYKKPLITSRIHDLYEILFQQDGEDGL